MTTVRDARIEAVKKAMLEHQKGYEGWDTTVPEYVAGWLAEAAVDALFTDDATSNMEVPPLPEAVPVVEEVDGK